MHRLRLDRGQVPPNVHFSKLNPTIDLDDFAAEIPITTTALTGTMLSSGQVSWLFSMGYAWIWWNSISEFSSLFSVHLRLESGIQNTKQEPMSLCQASPPLALAAPMHM